MIAGFHTISFLLHDEVTATEQLAKIGFGAVAIRPRLSGIHLDADDFQSRLSAIANRAMESSVKVVLDLSGRFLSDPTKELEESISSPNRDEASRAADQIQKWIESANILKPVVISISSGQRSGDSSHSMTENDFERLADRLEPLIDFAKTSGVKLAIRPAMTDLICTVAEFERFLQWLSPDSTLQVAPDIGEMLRGGEFPVGERLARHHRRMACVYLCEPEWEQGRDQRIGKGDIDMGRVWEVIESSGFDGPAIFRVFGHSEAGFSLAEEALQLVANHRNMFHDRRET